jgi:AMMECR1 domain-containing protein
MVPADRITSWADANVLKAEPKLLRRKLAYLMKTKSGRDYLRGQLASPAMSAETKDVVKAVITKHVEATKKLKRFDMINEEEVAELEIAISG